MANSRRAGRYKVNLRDTQRLTQALIITEDKSAVLEYGSSSGYTELVAFEGGPFRIKKVVRVQGAVSQEFIYTSVKSLGARASNCVDNSAGRTSVLRGIGATQD